MSAPNLPDCTAVPQQFYDAEPVVLTTTDWVPTRPAANAPQAARGLLCTTAGTVIVDCFGLAGAGTGATSVSIAMLAGQQLQIAVSKVHKTGTTGAFLAVY
jgi:hypothetical protein